MTEKITDKTEEPKKDPSLNFFGHLDELRERLMYCLYAFVIGFGLCYMVSDQLMAFLSAPLFQVLPEDQRKLYFTSLFENFLTHLKIAGYGSLFLFAPFYLYQVWGFIAPGLYPKERKMALPFIVTSMVFFVGGALFAYYGLFPVGFKYFISYGGPSDVPLLTIDSYYSTALKLMLLFGLAFEFPVIVVLLGFLGIVDDVFLRKNRKTVIIGITVISALFAPPDAISMLMLMCPLILLFEGSIWVVRALRLKKEKSKQDED
jgi:sec-independent protein translocase protein TatC